MERYYDRTDELRRDVAVNTDKIKTNSLRIINLESLVYLGKPGRVQIPNPDTQ